MATLSLEEDHYVVLGVRSDCDPSTVKAAWRAAARRYHPDAGGSPEDFARVRWAWDVLGDPEQRAEYDRQQRLRLNGTANASAPRGAGTHGSTQDSAHDTTGSRTTPRASTPSEDEPIAKPRTWARAHHEQTQDTSSPRLSGRTRTWTFPSAVAVLVSVFAAVWSLARPDLPEWILGRAELQSWMPIQEEYALVPITAAVLAVAAFGLSVRWRGWSWLPYPLAAVAVLLGAGALLAGVVATVFVGVGIVLGSFMALRILAEMFNDNSPSS